MFFPVELFDLVAGRFQHDVVYNPDSTKILSYVLAASFFDGYDNIDEFVFEFVYEDRISYEGRTKICNLKKMTKEIWDMMGHEKDAPRPHYCSTQDQSYIEEKMKKIFELLKNAKRGLLLWQELMSMAHFYFQNIKRSMIFQFDTIWQRYQDELVKCNPDISFDLQNYIEYALTDFYRMLWNNYMFSVEFMKRAEPAVEDSSYYNVITSRFQDVHYVTTHSIPRDIYSGDVLRGCYIEDFRVPLHKTEFSQKFLRFSLLSIQYFVLFVRWIVHDFISIEKSAAYISDPLLSFTSEMRSIIESSSNDWIWEDSTYSMNCVDFVIFVFETIQTLPGNKFDRPYEKDLETMFHTFPKKDKFNLFCKTRRLRRGFIEQFAHRYKRVVQDPWNKKFVKFETNFWKIVNLWHNEDRAIFKSLIE